MQNYLFTLSKFGLICVDILIYNITAYVKVVCPQHTCVLGSRACHRSTNASVTRY